MPSAKTSLTGLAKSPTLSCTKNYFTSIGTTVWYSKFVKEFRTNKFIRIVETRMEQKTILTFLLCAFALFGCSDGSSSRGNSSPENNHESYLKITSDNALPVVESIFNIFDGLNTHIPVLVDEYPNFYFGHLLPDQTQINCDYFGFYSFTLQEQDANNSQLNADDSLELNFSACRSSYGQYDGYVQRLVNLVEPSVEMGGDYYYDLDFSYLDFVFTDEYSTETVGNPAWYSLSGTLNLIETRSPDADIYQVTCKDWQVTWFDLNDLVESCEDFVFKETYDRQERVMYWEYDGLINRSDLDGLVEVTTLTPVELKFLSGGASEFLNGEVRVIGRESAISITLDPADHEQLLIAIDENGDQVPEEVQSVPIDWLLSR